jgi:hypothetical protein
MAVLIGAETREMVCYHSAVHYFGARSSVAPRVEVLRHSEVLHFGAFPSVVCRFAAHHSLRFGVFAALSDCSLSKCSWLGRLQSMDHFRSVDQKDAPATLSSEYRHLFSSFHPVYR